MANKNYLEELYKAHGLTMGESAKRVQEFSGGSSSQKYAGQKPKSGSSNTSSASSSSTKSSSSSPKSAMEELYAKHGMTPSSSTMRVSDNNWSDFESKYSSTVDNLKSKITDYGKTYGQQKDNRGIFYQAQRDFDSLRVDINDLMDELDTLGLDEASRKAYRESLEELLKATDEMSLDATSRIAAYNNPATQRIMNDYDATAYADMIAKQLAEAPQVQAFNAMGQDLGTTNDMLFNQTTAPYMWQFEDNPVQQLQMLERIVDMNVRADNRSGRRNIKPEQLAAGLLPSGASSVAKLYLKATEDETANYNEKAMNAYNTANALRSGYAALAQERKDTATQAEIDRLKQVGGVDRALVTVRTTIGDLEEKASEMEKYWNNQDFMNAGNATAKEAPSYAEYEKLLEDIEYYKNIEKQLTLEKDQEERSNVPAWQIQSGFGQVFNPSSLYDRVNANVFHDPYSDEAMVTPYTEFTPKKGVDTTSYPTASRAEAYMTDEERATFNSLWWNKGEEAAEDYFNRLLPTLEARGAAQVMGDVKKFTEANPELAWLNARGANFMKPISSIAMIGDIVKGNGVRANSAANLNTSIANYADAYAPEVGNWTGDAQILGRDLDQFLASTLGSTVDSGIRMWTASFLGGDMNLSAVDNAKRIANASNALMSLEVFPTAVLQEKEKGRDDATAVLLGATRAAIEGFTEKYSVELLFSPSANIGELIGKATFAEGAEEMAADILNGAVDIIARDRDNIFQEWDRRTSMGFDPSEALADILYERGRDTLADGLSGAISGLLFSVAGGSVGAFNITESSEAKALAKNPESVKALIDNVLAETPGNAVALRAKAQLEAGKTVSAKTIEKLFNENQRAFAKTDVQEIADAAATELSIRGEQHNIAEVADAIAKSVTGEQLMDGEIATLRNSVFGEQILSELNGEVTSRGNWTEQLRDNLEVLNIAQPKAEPKTVQRVNTTNATAATTDGKNVRILGLTDHTDGTVGVRVEDASGNVREIAASELDLDEDMQYLIDSASKFKGAAAVVYEAYVPGTDVGQYLSNASMVASYAKVAAGDANTAQNVLRVLKSNGSVDMLSDIQIDTIFNATLKEAARELKNAKPAKTNGKGKFTYNVKSVAENELDKRRAASVRLARYLAEIYPDIDIEIFESKLVNGKYVGEQGSYKDGKIRIDINAGINTIEEQVNSAMLRTLSHELTHHLQKTAPKQYAELKAFVFDHLAEWNNGRELEDLITSKQNRARGKLSRDAAIDEVVADSCEMMLANSKAIKQLAQQNKTLAEKIKNFVKKFILDLRAGFEGVEANDAAARYLRKFEKEMQQLWDNALRASVENSKTATTENAQKNTAPKDDVQYLLRSDIVDVNGKEYNTVVELDKRVSKRTLSSPRLFYQYVQDNFAGKTIPVLDSAGNTEIIEFAQVGETTTKGKGRHPVLGELGYAKGDTRKLVIVNLGEVASVSNYDPTHSNSNNEHGWLDKNGWESRTAYVLAPNNEIYSAHLKIAKARDGRKILYAVNLNIKDGIAVDMDATAKRAAVLAAMPSNKIITNTKSESQEQNSDTEQFSLRDTFIGKKRAPVFYSQLYKVVEGMKPNKISASALSEKALNNKGIKADEIAASGILDFVNGKKSVSKAELLDYIKSHQFEAARTELNNSIKNISVKNTSKTTKDIYSNGKLITTAEIGADGYWHLADDLSNEDTIATERALRNDKEIREYVARLTNRTRWNSYTLPGGKNYREVSFDVDSDYTNDAMQTHWGIGAKGILAHARVQDFRIVGGKLMFVEEVQSDWHTAGRKHGYEEPGVRYDKVIKNESAEALGEFYDTKVADSILDRLFQEGVSYERGARLVEDLFSGEQLAADAIQDKIGDFTEAEWEAIENAAQQEVSRKDELKTSPYLDKEAAPVAPFSENYYDYVMKNLVREAAENGYSYIGWTPSEIQDERYANDEDHKPGTGKSGYLKGYIKVYDQGIKSFMAKLGKPYGVQPTVVTLPNGQKVWGMELPSGLKDSVLYEGQTQFSERDRAADEISRLEQRIEALERGLTESTEGISEEAMDRLATLENSTRRAEAALAKRIAELEKIEKRRNDETNAKERARLREVIDAKQKEISRLRRKIKSNESQIATIQDAAGMDRDSVMNELIKSRKLHESAKEGYRKRKEKVIADLKQELADKKAAYKQQMSDYRAGRKRTLTIESIKRAEKNLQNQLLGKGGKGAYVPTNLVKSAIAVAQLINTAGNETYTRNGKVVESKAFKDYVSVKDALRDLQEEYNQLPQNPDPEYAQEYSREFEEMLQDLRETIGDKNVRQLTNDELEDVNMILRQLGDTLADAKMQIGKLDALTNYEVAERIWDEMNAVRRVDGKKMREIGNKLDLEILSPLRNINRMVGYVENSALRDLFNDLNDGIKKQNAFRMDANKYFDQLRTEKTDRKLFAEAVNDRKEFDIKDVNGRNVSMSMMQAMQLILSYEREASNKKTSHLENGGAIIPNEELLRKGKVADAILQGTIIPRVTLTDINNVRKDVNKFGNGYGKRFMQASKYFFNTISKDAVNDTTMKTKHRPVATERDYIPFTVDPGSTASVLEGLKYDHTIEGSGLLKSVRPNASNALVIVGLNSVIEQHIEEVAKIYGLTIPIRNFDKAWNVKKIGSQMTTKKAVGYAWGSAGQKMIEQTLADLQSSRKTAQGDAARVWNEIRGNFVKKTLLINLSVTIKQAASYSVAGLHLSQRALAPYQTRVVDLFVRPNSKFAQDLYEEIDTYTPEHWIRRQGMSSQEVGDFAMKDNWLTEVDHILPASANPLKWIQGMDVATTGALWLAAKKQVELDGKYEKGTDEYWTAVTKLYEDTIEETQPMYDVLHRPEMQKTTSDLLKSIFMFKTQPLQNTGIIYDSYGEMVAMRDAAKSGKVSQEKAKASTKKFVTAVATQIASLSVFATMSLVARAALHKMKRYRDDDDELTVESVLKRMGLDMMSSAAGIAMPFGGTEMFEFIDSVFGQDMKWNDSFSVPAVQMVNDFVESLGNAGVAIWKWSTGEGDAKKVLVALKDFGYEASGVVAGIPAQNVENILVGAIDNIRDIVNGKVPSFNNDVERTNGTNYRRMLNAVIDGDAAKYDEVYNEVYAKLTGESNKTEKDARADIQTGFAEAVKKMFIDGDITEEDARKYLAEYAGRNDGAIDLSITKWKIATNKSEEKAISKALAAGEITSDEAVKQLSALGIDPAVAYEAVMDSIGRSKYFELDEAMKNDADIKGMLDRLVGYGIDEKNITDRVKENIKAMYLGTEDMAATIDAATAENMLVDYAGVDANDAHFTVKGYGVENFSKFDDLREAMLNGGDVDAAVAELVEYGTSEATVVSEIRSGIKEWYQGAKNDDGTRDDPLIDDDKAIDLLMQHGNMDEAEAAKAVLEWSAVRDTGMDDDDIKQAFLADELTTDEVIDLQMTYFGKSEEAAELKIASWLFADTYGYPLDDVGAEFKKGNLDTDEVIDILTEYSGKNEREAKSSLAGYTKDAYKDGLFDKSKTQSILINECGLDSKNVQEFFDAYEFSQQHGWAYDNRATLYKDGDITATELRSAMMSYGGMTSEEADLQIKVYDFEKQGYDNVTASRIENYAEYCAAKNVPYDIYFDLCYIKGNTENDKDPVTGESIGYSAVKKVMAQINATSLTSEQKTAVALTFWKSSTVYQYKTW